MQIEHYKNLPKLHITIDKNHCEEIPIMFRGHRVSYKDTIEIFSSKLKCKVEIAQSLCWLADYQVRASREPRMSEMHF